MCQATLQLINSLLECPLAPVFLRELVFDGSPATTSMTNWKTTTSPPRSSQPPNNPQTPHTPDSPKAPQTPRSPHTPTHAFAATSTPLPQDSTTTGSSLARQRKQLEHWINRSVQNHHKHTHTHTHTQSSEQRETESKTEVQMLWSLFLNESTMFYILCLVALFVCFSISLPLPSSSVCAHHLMWCFPFSLTSRPLSLFSRSLSHPLRSVFSLSSPPSSSPSPPLPPPLSPTPATYPWYLRISCLQRW